MKEIIRFVEKNSFQEFEGDEDSNVLEFTTREHGNVYAEKYSQIDCIWDLCGTPLENGWTEAMHLPNWSPLNRPAVKRNLIGILGKENKNKLRKKFFRPKTLEILDGLLCLNPAKRLTCAQLLKH